MIKWTLVRWVQLLSIKSVACAIQEFKNQNLTSYYYDFIVNSSKSCFFNLSLTEKSVWESTTHAFGNTTHALGNTTHALGKTTHALGNATHALGNTTHAFGNATHACGSTTHQAENEFKGGYCTIVLKIQIKYSNIINN